MQVQDLAPVVGDDEKAVQNIKRWDGEEVHRSNCLAMVSQERQPSLHRICISRGSPDPSRDTPFRDLETQLEQFAVNARRSPDHRHRPAGEQPCEPALPGANCRARHE